MHASVLAYAQVRRQLSEGIWLLYVVCCCFLLQVPALGWRKRDVNGNLGAYSWLTYSQVMCERKLHVDAAATTTAALPF
jgi:hypothetical protein